MELNDILKAAIRHGASDVHLKAGLLPVFRINGKLVPLKVPEPLHPEELSAMSTLILTEEQRKKFELVRELDCAYSVSGLGRFRVNIFIQRGTIGIVLRVVPIGVQSFEELHLPKVLEKVALENRGLVLCTGTTGCGKSTTLASSSSTSIFTAAATSLRSRTRSNSSSTTGRASSTSGSWAWTPVPSPGRSGAPCGRTPT